MMFNKKWMITKLNTTDSILTFLLSWIYKIKYYMCTTYILNKLCLAG